METFLTIASKRDTRNYDARTVPDEVATRILDAGRLAGSAKNRQPWRFVVVDSLEVRERIAEAVYAPGNVRGAALVIVLVSSSALDGGRAAQNMVLAAWTDGVASCPNGMPEPERVAQLLGLPEGDKPLLVLTFGYPARGRPPQTRSAEEWSARAGRRPLDELVTRV